MEMLVARRDRGPDPACYPEKRIWDLNQDPDPIPAHLFPANADAIGPSAFDYNSFRRDVAYNAKSQREEITFGNGTKSTYQYEPETFRLSHLETIRTSDSKKFQDIE